MKSNYSALGRLVTFRTTEDFEIIGILFQKNSHKYKDISLHDNKRIVIHIHGSFGNFYQNKFIWYMSEMYCNDGIDFLSINTSAHDGLSEGYYGKNLKYVGGAITDYNESQKDIEAAISFVQELHYEDIILQGHSLGCDKIIDYTIRSKNNLDVILLSPADSYAVQENWMYPQTVCEQIKRLRTSQRPPKPYVWGDADFDWLNPKEYGAHGKNNDWVYNIPVTRETLLSILTGSAFKYLNMKYPQEFFANVNAIAFIGKNDALLFVTPKELSDFLSKKFKSFSSITDIDSDHDIIGAEEEMIRRIIKWIKARDSFQSEQIN